MYILVYVSIICMNVVSFNSYAFTSISEVTKYYKYIQHWQVWECCLTYHIYLNTPLSSVQFSGFIYMFFHVQL
jgi:hypothetical protein